MGKRRVDKLTLAPLDFEVALEALLDTDPPPPEPQKAEEESQREEPSADE